MKVTNEGDEKSIFFWQRINQININTVAKLIDLENIKIDEKDVNSSKVEIINIDKSENKSQKTDNRITIVEGFTGRKHTSGAIKCIIYKDEIINNSDKNGRIEFWLNTSKKNNCVYGSLIE